MRKITMLNKIMITLGVLYMTCIIPLSGYTKVTNLPLEIRDRELTLLKQNLHKLETKVRSLENRQTETDKINNKLKNIELRQNIIQNDIKQLKELLNRLQTSLRSIIKE